MASKKNTLARRRKSYHHGDLRRALIETALKRVAEEGTGALTLRDVARRVGVSQAAPYRHFRDKLALLQAVAEEGFRALMAQMDEALGSTERPLERFQALGRAYAEFAIENAAHTRVMWSPDVLSASAPLSLQEAAQATYQKLVEAVTAAQRAGVVRSGDPTELAICAWGVMHGMSALIIDGAIGPKAPGPLDKSVPALMDLMLTTTYLGLRP
jgi:AcrR family transcriptional regulator